MIRRMTPKERDALRTKACYWPGTVRQEEIGAALDQQLELEREVASLKRKLVRAKATIRRLRGRYGKAEDEPEKTMRENIDRIAEWNAAEKNK